MQILGQSLMPVHEHIRGDRSGLVIVVAGEHAVLGRVQAGQQRGNRRLGPAGGGNGIIEHHRSLGELVDVRRSGSTVAVTAEMIRSQRVHHHDQDVGLALFVGASWRQEPCDRGGQATHERASSAAKEPKCANLASCLPIART
jgi:hypothetical protein